MDSSSSEQTITVFSLPGTAPAGAAFATPLPAALPTPGPAGAPATGTWANPSSGGGGFNRHIWLLDLSLRQNKT